MKRHLRQWLHGAAGTLLRAADRIEPPQPWPAGCLWAEAWRDAYGSDEADRPAALGWEADADGMVHRVPLSVEAAIYEASVLLAAAPWEEAA